MDQRLSLVTLGVSDLDRARRFYEGLGWTTGWQEGEDVVFFQAGGMVIALWGRDQLAADTGIRDSGAGLRAAMRWRGLEPPRGINPTRPSTLRVYQFRHQRAAAL